MTTAITPSPYSLPFRFIPGRRGDFFWYGFIRIGAKFKQQRYNDYTPNLLVAIGIAQDPNYQSYIRNPGAAFCIYAQVLQKQDKQDQAKQSWQECRKLLELRPSEDRNLEETQWFYEAQKQLQ